MAGERKGATDYNRFTDRFIVLCGVQCCIYVFVFPPLAGSTNASVPSGLGL